MLPRKSLPILLALAWALSWGCSRTDVQLGEEVPDAQQGFTPPVLDASVEAGPDARPELLACIGTECPYPFATFGSCI